MKKILAAAMLFSQSSLIQAQEIIPLYNGEIPNSKKTSKVERTDTAADGKQRTYNVTQPTLTVYLPPSSKANGVAVIICPGGGYRLLANSHEGSDVAKVFNSWGITAFVLKYRMPDDETMIDKTIGPLQDAQRAIQLVRESAKTWLLNPKKIGIMGFSAGGHLASTAAVHFDKDYIDNPLKTSLRPDFAVLVYPVISFQDDIASKGTREQLLGKAPYQPAQLQFFSGELNVTKKTPPSFLVHAKDDKTVKIENSMRFMDALDKNKIKFSNYFYDGGGHGFGLINPTSSMQWMTLLQQWLFDLEIINKKY